MQSHNSKINKTLEVIRNIKINTRELFSLLGYCLEVHGHRKLWQIRQSVVKNPPNFRT